MKDYFNRESVLNGWLFWEVGFKKGGVDLNLISQAESDAIEAYCSECDFELNLQFILIKLYKLKTFFKVVFNKRLFTIKIVFK